MPQKGITSIRTQAARQNFSKGGSTSLYVDKSHLAASDNNDGFSWDRPLKTIQGAMDILEPWMEIWIKTGTYSENVVIDKENVILHGVVQSGLDRVEISPSIGVPLDVQVGYSDLEGIALVSTASNALKLTGPGHHIHDAYIEVNTNGLAQHTGVLLNDADKMILENCHLNGKFGLNTIGCRVDGTLNASVDCIIRDNYFQNFGTIGVAGQGLNLNNAQRCLVTNNIFDAGYNGIYCEAKASSLHSIVGNQFYANDGIDIVDLNVDQLVSGIFINNNFYGYTDWFDDYNHDGIANVPIQAYYNYDYSPLSHPHYQGPSFVPRFIP
jgi:nitrous oxidase accessory protein NosD